MKGLFTLALVAVFLPLMAVASSDVVRIQSASVCGGFLEVKFEGHDVVWLSRAEKENILSVENSLFTTQEILRSGVVEEKCSNWQARILAKFELQEFECDIESGRRFLELYDKEVVEPKRTLHDSAFFTFAAHDSIDKMCN